jgi:hypothetical protein
MAMALLMMQNGSTLMRQVLSGYPLIYWSPYANTNAAANMGRTAPRNDLITTQNFERFKVNSREPSNTITISPIVPKTGSTADKDGISIPRKIVTCFNPQPSRINKITDGIFVFDAVRSNRYEISNKQQKIIITVIVIQEFC